MSDHAHLSVVKESASERLDTDDQGHVLALEDPAYSEDLPCVDIDNGTAGSCETNAREIMNGMDLTTGTKKIRATEEVEMPTYTADKNKTQETLSTVTGGLGHSVVKTRDSTLHSQRSSDGEFCNPSKKMYKDETNDNTEPSSSDAEESSLGEHESAVSEDTENSVDTKSDVSQLQTSYRQDLNKAAESVPKTLSPSRSHLIQETEQLGSEDHLGETTNESLSHVEDRTVNLEDEKGVTVDDYQDKMNNGEIEHNTVRVYNTETQMPSCNEVSSLNDIYLIESLPNRTDSGSYGTTPDHVDDHKLGEHMSIGKSNNIIQDHEPNNIVNLYEIESVQDTNVDYKSLKYPSNEHSVCESDDNKDVIMQKSKEEADDESNLTIQHQNLNDKFDVSGHELNEEMTIQKLIKVDDSDSKTNVENRVPHSEDHNKSVKQKQIDDSSDDYNDIIFVQEFNYKPDLNKGISEEQQKQINALKKNIPDQNSSDQNSISDLDVTLNVVKQKSAKHTDDGSNDSISHENSNNEDNLHKVLKDDKLVENISIENTRAKLNGKLSVKKPNNKNQTTDANNESNDITSYRCHNEHVYEHNELDIENPPENKNDGETTPNPTPDKHSHNTDGSPYSAKVPTSPPLFSPTCEPDPSPAGPSAPSPALSHMSESCPFLVPAPSPVSAPASSTSWASVSTTSVSALDAATCDGFTHTFLTNLVAAENNTFSSDILDRPKETSDNSKQMTSNFQPLRRASSRICKQIQSLQEQLKVASSSSATSPKTIEKLKQQLVEAKEMSASFENIKRQRSASRHSQLRALRASTPGKVVRPYRQWQTLSPCVTTDPRYIFSSKEDRKSKITPFMKVKVKTSDHLYQKRFQTLTGINLQSEQKDIGNIDEEIKELPTAKHTRESRDTSLFPNTKQLVSDIETRVVKQSENMTSDDDGKLNTMLASFPRAHEQTESDNSSGNVVKISKNTDIDLIHLVEQQSNDTVAVGWDAAFYHRRNINRVPTLGRRHSMLLVGTPKPYIRPNQADGHLSCVDLYSRQLTRNERFEKASQRINPELRISPLQKIQEPSPGSTHSLPQGPCRDSAISPVIKRRSSVSGSANTDPSDNQNIENEHIHITTEENPRRYHSPARLSLTSDSVFGPEDDDPDPAPSRSPYRAARPSPRRPSRPPPRDVTVHHPRTTRPMTTSRLRRQKDRSLHRAVFRAGSRPPGVSVTSGRPAGYGIYMKEATEYIERVEHAARGGTKDESLASGGGGATSGGVTPRELSITDVQSFMTTSSHTELSGSGSKDVLAKKVVGSIGDETQVAPQQTYSHFMQKVHREKKKNKGGKYVTVMATKEHPGNLPGQLSFRAGQVIQLRCPQFEPTDGLCYGHFRTGRFRKKKKGLFPISYIRFPCELQTSL